jgi:hypothetical protein
LYFVSDIKEIGINEQFQVDLMLDTQGESLNAIEGIVEFPVDLLTLLEVREGNSIISLWVDSPFVEKPGSVVFSGITPGGFSGVLSPYYEGYQDGKVFSLIFQTKKPGQGNVNLQEAKVLLNDGQGTKAKLVRKPFELKVSDYQSEIKILVYEDKNPPENFIAEINKDEAVFGGQYFLIFNAQDKESGIHHYEVKENGRDWVEAKSPYLLEDQKIKKYTYVRVFDKYSNSKIIAVAPVYTASWYENYLNWVIIIIIIAVLIIIKRRRRSL